MSQSALPDELPDVRHPDLEQHALTAVRIYNASRREARQDETGECEAWLAVDSVVFTLAVLHNAWLE
jgi:hypothetical protein